MRIKNTMNVTKQLIAYNTKLTEAQKQRLRQTPFKWVVDMTENIVMNASLLEEMLSRWDPISYGFRVSCKTVAFTPLDVCFALGLQIVGTTVTFDDDNSDCHVKSLFTGEEITVESIVKKLSVLNNEENLEDFCRVYILFAFFALYFPRKSKIVNKVPFKLLDDLNMLETYNWGGAVYQFLVDSITRAAGEYAKQKASEIIISGCSAVLQIWFLEHLPSCSVSKNYFPRIIKWTNLPERSAKIGNIFKNAKLVEDLVPTEQDKQFEVVLEAIRETAVRLQNDMNIDVDVQDVLTQQRKHLAENEDFRERIARLEEGMKLVKVDKGSKEESGSGKKNEARGSKEESGEGKKEGDKGGEEVSNHKIMQRLFQACTNVENEEFLFTKVYGQPMRGHLFRCLRPREWVSSLLMSAATKIMMGELLKNRGGMKRFIITNAFADHVIAELPHFHDVGITMTEHSFGKLVSNHLSLPAQDPIKIMKHCNLIFAPTIHNEHWFCYVLDKRKKKLFVLNSLFNGRNEEEKKLDLAMKEHFEMLLDFMHEKDALELVYEDVPQQKNFCDCGIYVLKFLEMWDGERKWGDKTMPDFTLDEIFHFRQHFVCRWVLHPENVQLKHAREKIGLPVDFSIDSLDKN
ncbi:Ulp1 peptidase [Trifolium repens]|nr:Ulp1 peptidase [Trifolium repens]